MQRVEGFVALAELYAPFSDKEIKEVIFSILNVKITRPRWLQQWVFLRLLGNNWTFSLSSSVRFLRKRSYAFTSKLKLISYCTIFYKCATKSLCKRIKELPIRYLGTPITVSILSKVECKSFVDKILARIKIWSSKSICHAVRVTLINFVLFGMFNFWGIHLHSSPRSC
ncbi:hypothetical protein Cgig2_025759 [Carnegiea gigantea]|uniref:Reverse transcriptase n=1 Tax=Carnegiea gigantea TaxID=171969 RepID=A0A9Q1Q6F1_9CARY|nr:hypothetical protein Cgig2_025759 [Carnegiea gigantea]